MKNEMNDVNKKVDKYTNKNVCEGTYKKPCEDNSEANTEDVVNNPKHYKLYQHECIDEMILVFGIEDVKAFCKCNIWKYRYRASAKNGEEDLRKAEWYMNKLEELNKL